MTSTETVAQLILININRFAAEKNKEYSRVKISKKSLRKIAGRSIIRDAFIEALQEKFFGLGWHFGVHSDTEYYLIEKKKLDAWGRVGCSRVEQEINGLKTDPEWYADQVGSIFAKECGQPDELAADED